MAAARAAAIDASTARCRGLACTVANIRARRWPVLTLIAY